MTASYINAYLTVEGLPTAVIGLLTGVFGGLSALVQPTLGRLADTDSRFNWKTQLFVWDALNMTVMVLILAAGAPVLKGVLFGFSFFVVSNMMPFINGAGFYYEQCGQKLNYGLARGMGSLFFSIIAFLLGLLFERHGGDSVILAGLIISAVLLLCIFRMPYQNKENIKMASEDFVPRAGRGGFIKRYPHFMVMMFACLLLMTFHNATNNYMLQIMQQVGGGSKDMSFALSLSGMVEFPVVMTYSFWKKKASSSSLMFISALAFTAKGAAYLLASSVIWVILPQLLQSLSFAVYTSSSVYYALEQMSGADMLRGQSLLSSVGTAGVVLGNVLGGVIIQQAGVRVNLWIAFALALTASLLMFFLREPRSEKIV